MFEATKNEKVHKQILFSSNEELLKWTYDKSLEIRKIITYYKCAVKEVATKFEVLDEEDSLLNDRNPINGIHTRIKSIPSIMEKLERKGFEVSPESVEKNLNDVAGVRVICSFEEDVYKLAEAFLKQDDVTLIEIKDYIKNPKPNGYRSLHLIVAIPIFLEKEKKMMKVEIQLRTIAMDCWASLEHQLRYKKGKEFTEDMQSALLKCADLSRELDSEMDRLRKECNI